MNDPLPTPGSLNPEPIAQPARPAGESARAAEAFRVYLELGPQRRYAAVADKIGASLRTVKGWALEFDWRGRIKTHAAQCAEQYTETEITTHREDCLDAAARAKAFRDRQYAVAEAMLDAAERYLERMVDGDVDLMSFADACKALEVASRIGQQAARSVAEDPAALANSLGDQLTALLDQACAESPAKTGAK
ncbi:MAG: hypothetical protein WCO56_06110 [Verrucomicrobiota bacterium]